MRRKRVRRVGGKGVWSQPFSLERQRKVIGTLFPVRPGTVFSSAVCTKITWSGWHHPTLCVCNVEGLSFTASLHPLQFWYGTPRTKTSITCLLICARVSPPRRASTHAPASFAADEIPLFQFAPPLGTSLNDMRELDFSFVMLFRAPATPPLRDISDGLFVAPPARSSGSGPLNSSVGRRCISQRAPSPVCFQLLLIRSLNFRAESSLCYMQRIWVH